MRKRFAMLAMVALVFGLVTGAIAPPTALANDTGKTQPMYRCYNPNSGEHFYTASEQERDHIVSVGWRYEGVGWTAPGKSSTPVYRLYNPNAGDHHYTTSLAERNHLVSVGWRYEGVGWYSSDAKLVPLYRQYNPNAVTGTHNYTTSKGENDYLVKVGWRAEGIGWYGVGGGTYTVKFVTETDQGTKVVSEQKLKIGQAVQLPDDPARDRYEFRGWGDGVSEGMTCQGDATYEAVWAPDGVDSTSGDYGTQLSYMDNTKSVTGTVSADGKSATIPTDQARQLERGDIVIVNPTDPYEMTAIKVGKVTRSGGSTVVSGEKANPVDYVKQLSMKSDPQQSGDWMFVPESELEAAGASRPARRPSATERETASESIAGMRRSEEGLYITSSGVTLVGEVAKKGLKYKITTGDIRRYLGLKEGESENLSVDATISLNPKVTADIEYELGKNFTRFETNIDLGADIKAKISNSTNAEGEKLVYRLGVIYSPDPTVPVVLQLFATFHADGTVELSTSAEESVSIVFQDGKFDTTRSEDFGKPSISADANCEIGIMPSVAFGWPELLIGDFDLEGGAAGSAKLTHHIDPTMQCVDLRAWFFLSVETAQCDDFEKRVLDNLKETKGIDVHVELIIYNETNSPLKVSWHFEDGKAVPYCTWIGTDSSNVNKQVAGLYGQILDDIQNVDFSAGWGEEVVWKPQSYEYALQDINADGLPDLLVLGDKDCVQHYCAWVGAADGSGVTQIQVPPEVMTRNGYPSSLLFLLHGSNKGNGLLCSLLKSGGGGVIPTTQRYVVKDGKLVAYGDAIQSQTAGDLAPEVKSEIVELNFVDTNDRSLLDALAKGEEIPPAGNTQHS